METVPQSLRHHPAAEGAGAGGYWSPSFFLAIPSAWDGRTYGNASRAGSTALVASRLPLRQAVAPMSVPRHGAGAEVKARRSACDSGVAPAYEKQVVPAGHEPQFPTAGPVWRFVMQTLGPPDSGTAQKQFPLASGPQSPPPKHS